MWLPGRNHWLLGRNHSGSDSGDSLCCAAAAALAEHYTEQISSSLYSSTYIVEKQRLVEIGRYEKVRV
jgi:hypothetical protein